MSCSMNATKQSLDITKIRAKFNKIWAKVLGELNQISNNQQQTKYNIKDQTNNNIKHQTINSVQNKQKLIRTNKTINKLRLTKNKYKSIKQATTTSKIRH